MIVYELFLFLCFWSLCVCRSAPLTSKDLSAQQHKKCPTLAHMETKPALPPKKWNASDCDRVYGGSGKEEKTYSQAFTKKLLNTTPTKSLKPGGQAKWERSVMQNVSATTSPEELDTSTVSINNILLEGRGIDREVGEPSREPQLHRKKSKKGDLHQTSSKNRVTISSSLFGCQEGVGERRPSIERGGTNTISMEVSGVGSWNSAESHSQQASHQLSKNTKDSILQKKQKHETSGDFDVTEKTSHSATYPNSTKKSSQVLPIEHGYQVEVTSASTSASSNISSAPVETTHKRIRKKRSTSDSTHPAQTLSLNQQRSGSPPKRRSHSYNKHTFTLTDMDMQFGGRSGSPLEPDLALLENHVHANPDQAVKTALQSLANEDWNNKREGIDMIIIIAHDFPNLLLAQLHAVLMALQKEVPHSIICIVVYST